MLFGSKNPPATFRRVMKVIFSMVKRQYALVYFVDIVIFVKELESHIENTRLVLRLLRGAGDTSKLKKCAFSSNQIGFLGHLIKPGKPKVPEHTADANRKLRVPTTVTKLRLLLRLNMYIGELCLTLRESRHDSQNDFLSCKQKRFDPLPKMN